MSKLFSENSIIIPDSGSASYDAFGRLRSSTPLSLFSDRGYINNELYWSTAKNAGGTINSIVPNLDSQVKLDVPTTSGAYVYRQTRSRFVYEPARSIFASQSCSLNPQKTNLRQRVGLFDTNDGLYFEDNGSEYRFVRRNSSTGTLSETVYSQSAWNLDKFNGSGASGINIDFTKSFVFIVDFTWHGAGIVRFGFLINGKPFYAHRVDLSINIDSGPFMGNPTLPLRQEIENTGTTASASTFSWKACSIASEGDFAIQGAGKAVRSGNIEKTISTTLLPILSLRINPATTNLSVIIGQYELLNTSNTPIIYQILRNATLTGTNWVDESDFSQSDVSATAVTGGQQTDTGFNNGRTGNLINSAKDQVRLGFDIDGTPDTYTIAARTVSGNADVFASIRFIEAY